MQLHSVPISEPVALASGLITGLVGSAFAAAVGMDPTGQMWVAGTVSTVVNVLIGAKINLMALDILALLIMRPLSPMIGLSVLRAILAT